MSGDKLAVTAAETVRARRKAARKPYSKPRPVVVPANWRELQTVPVPVYAAIIGIAKNTAYQACADGDVATIKVGGRVLVCVPPLLRQLNGEERLSGVEHARA